MSAPASGDDAAPRIRDAVQDDLAAIVAIYNHYVVHTVATFDLTPVRVDERQAWFAQFASHSRHRMLVATGPADDLLGYAYSGPLRPRAAYDRSVETSIYLRPDAIGQGLGTRLYGNLLDGLALTDVHRCYGVITWPNPDSIRLHERLGFREVGRLTECGHKFDQWWDVVWMERSPR